MRIATESRAGDSSRWSHARRAAFTLVELITSLVLLTLLLLALLSASDAASRAWSDGQKRTETFQSARNALELLGRELAPAVVDTRMQFVVAPGTVLQQAGAQNVAPNSPALLWMSPEGEGGELRCLGYYLYRDTTKGFYRLKRLLVAPTDATGKTSPWFPRLSNEANPRDPQLRTSPVDAQWFTRQWGQEVFDEEDSANDNAAVSAVSDGVVAFWVQCVDLLGRPIPLLSKAKAHPRSDLYFNSAAYFQVATTAPFDGGASFAYLAETEQSMKANRVPAAIEITLVTIDKTVVTQGLQVPEQSYESDDDGILDVPTLVAEYEAALQKNKIYQARTFTTRIRLINGR